LKIIGTKKSDTFRIRSKGKMKELVLSLLAGWVIGVVLSQLHIPLPAPPPSGLLGLAGMTLGGFCFQWMHKFLGSSTAP